MIFPVLKVESVVQVNDKTRLDGLKSFISPDESAITLIEIEPESSAGYIDVTSGKFLDWQYVTDGVKTATIRITTDGSPVSFASVVTIVLEADDKLFSTDQDIFPLEPELSGFINPGRSSYLDVHREAQKRILSRLNEMGFLKSDRSRLTKNDIHEVLEVRDWSKFLALKIIYEGISNANDDIFANKSRKYKVMVEGAESRSRIQFDTNQDGNADAESDLRSFTMVRR